MLCQFETARGRKKKGMLEKVHVCVLVKQECLLLVPQNKLGRDVKKKLGDQHSVQKISTTSVVKSVRQTGVFSNSAR